ncbi:type II toxin-antitoxin system RelE/ParE family toxin [Rhizobium sp. AAP43]|uniref:type II toxin-antitoxin system RelE/ParE family toxin n=1 Tax=Rhizobium sp. AAP43 TaxID=1523420 RepID=UPI0006B93711|nr:type II toxin-antitoxin system RelE/ParE family toxin [Rhizobium sp. AAP43]KPF42253.1 addiction module toxin RelE [Rhizobium sp. AAP43]
MRERVFKTAWFDKAARKAGLSDRILLEAIRNVALGQADDLGGGVFKKRLNDNRHRAIILAKADAFWVYTYIFAKQDRANIDEGELQAFRKLAALYRQKTATDLEAELLTGALKEICRDEQG